MTRSNQKPQSIIIKTLEDLLPEYQFIESNKSTLKYKGIIDLNNLTTIQNSLELATHKSNIVVSNISYKDGHSLIHYKTTPKKPSVSDSKTKSQTKSSLPKESKTSLSQFKLQLLSIQKDYQNDLKSLSQISISSKYLGKKGLLNQLTSLIPKLPTKDRAQAGKLINQLKKNINQQIKNHQPSAISQTPAWLDVTLPGQKPPIGHLHPVSQAINRITSIFESIGFTRVRYPEVDWDYYSFESLNMPSNHPARDEWETFFIDTKHHQTKGGLVLTPHTSNGQVREMERVGKPPIRMLNIARCYRRQQDVTHTAMFHQFEGLVVDHGINIQHLKGTLDYFAQHFYGPKAKSRIRPFMFKFTEPSFEVDFSCVHCNGTGKIKQTNCRFCKSGWHEVGGAGMVHPNVLKFGGIDPEEFTGFAFGWGIERVYTLQPGLELDDIRPLYQNNLDFLSQF